MLNLTPISEPLRRSGGIGRRTGLKILCSAMNVRVRVPPSAQGSEQWCERLQAGVSLCPRMSLDFSQVFQ